MDGGIDIAEILFVYFKIHQEVLFGPSFLKGGVREVNDEGQGKGRLAEKLAQLSQRVVQLEQSELKSRQEIEMLQGQLEGVQELESIGILAGGFAHDFNNLLTAIMGNIDLSRIYAQPGDEIHESLSEAKKACGRARDLTEGLIQLSKGWTAVKRPGHLGEMVKASAGLALRDSGCQCEFSIPENLWRVEFDQRYLQNAMAHLICKFVESMGQGGTIKVSIENVTLGGEKTEPVTSMAKGSYVKITIQNHGKGIPKQEIGKIFESYFSLERIMTGKKNGLGAATSLPIIKKHGGYLHVDSKAGTGAILYVYLPAAGKGRGDRASQC